MSNSYKSPFATKPVTPSSSLLAQEEPMGAPSAGAGLLDVTVASVMPDIESKISYYSQQLTYPENGLVSGRVRLFIGVQMALYSL